MCGIAGIIDFGKGFEKHPILEKMLSAISYRGPDDSGIYNSEFASIGNNRLSIIDIEGGKQPMSDQSKRYWIVFNGEIFNYPELRIDLIKKGYLFNTQSDTEVVVQLYAAYGKECLSMLNGQFAIAIWDKQKQELFLARDRVGIRPLFYTKTAESFFFASEIKCFFEHDGIIPQLEIKNLLQIYTFWTAITPNTAFKNIFELSPGEYLLYNREGIVKDKYWELDFGKTDSSISFSDAKEKFNELLADSVKIRLRSDVEVGAYLSGGIDSAATLASIKKTKLGGLNTFSIGFEEDQFDETPFQKEAVNYFNSSHNSILCTSLDIAEAFPRVVWHSETPLMRTAPSAMYLLSKEVRAKGIKVVLTGEGADEILAGYNIFKEAKIRKFWSNQPESAFRPLLLKKLYPYLPQMKNANPTILKMFFGFKLEDVNNPFYSHLIRWNNSNHILKHINTDILEKQDRLSSYEALNQLLPKDFNSWGTIAKAQWLETKIFMSGYLLSSQGDRMALANSVEGRYPFLDYRLIEFCATLPDSYKLNCLNEKFLLKKAMHNRIPEKILHRSKQAYRAPIKSAFLSENSPEYCKQMLSPEHIRQVGIFNPDSLGSVLKRINTSGISTETDNMLLTFVISTHLLYDQFINKNNSYLKSAGNKHTHTINDY
jgi:asparagine synthase (glutamine-hydrolysing)